jgi:hypothetical protein
MHPKAATLTKKMLATQTTSTNTNAPRAVRASAPIARPYAVGAQLIPDEPGQKAVLFGDLREEPAQHAAAAAGAQPALDVGDAGSGDVEIRLAPSICRRPSPGTGGPSSGASAASMSSWAVGSTSPDPGRGNPPSIGTTFRLNFLKVLPIPQ